MYYSKISITFVVLLMPWMSSQCNYPEATICLNKIQIIYDQFKTDMLNKSYVPKPSPQARICGNMEKDSPESQCFFNALKNCTQETKDFLQIQWNVLKEDHDQKCSGVYHMASGLLLVMIQVIIPILQLD